jgi:thioredoxin-like negative regulator of GroEL
MTNGTAATAAKPDRRRGQQPRLVLFYSPRCGKSRRVDGYLAQVLQRRRNHATFSIMRIDADQRPDLADRFQITEVPTLLVIDRDRICARLSEPRGSKEITELLRPWLT